MSLDRSEGGFGRRREFEAGEGGTGDVGGDADGAGDLRQGHVLDMIVAEGFEEALSGGKEFLGGIPFLLAETVEAIGPIGGLFALTFRGVEGLLLEDT